MPHFICCVCHTAKYVAPEKYNSEFGDINVCENERCASYGDDLDIQHFLGHNPWACSYCDNEKEAIQKGVCNVGRSRDFYQCGNKSLKQKS